MFKFIPSDIFKRASEVNQSQEVVLQSYTHGDQEVWLLKNVWKNLELLRQLSYEFPVVSPELLVNASNPFFKQAVPQEITVPFTKMLPSLLVQHGKIKNCDIRILQTWANIYQHSKITVNATSIYPHCDSHGAGGLVANVWLHPQGSNHATAFWQMRDSGSVVDSTDFKSAREQYLRKNKKLVTFFNFPGDEKIKKVLQVPANYGDVTLYYVNQIHSPVVSYDENVIRHSWCFHLGLFPPG